jgi:hypothetical protein
MMSILKLKTKVYWTYFKYIVQHKKNVGIECLKKGMWWHAITHDLSKFLPSEFFPYAVFFHKKNRAKEYNQSDETDEDFLSGWTHHQKRNKHHWNYWVSVTRKDEIIPIPMPNRYIHQMIADWDGMARKFGGNSRQYFMGHNEGMLLHPSTRSFLFHWFSVSEGRWSKQYLPK